MQKLLNQARNMNPFRGVEIVDVLLWASILVLVIGLPLAIYYQATTTKIELIEDEWHCTAYKSVAGTIIVGKTIVPTHRQVCITWEMTK